jgi:hypothetical protein
MSEEAAKADGQDEGAAPVNATSVPAVEKKGRAEPEGNGLLAGLSEEYMSWFDEIKWAKLGARDPYWPCIVYHPLLAPPKNKSLNAWSKKGAKRENFYICMWFGYGNTLSYSCVSKKNIVDWDANKDEFEKTNGGKKKLSTKEQGFFQRAIEEASGERAKPKTERLRQLHIDLTKQTKKRRRLPPVDKLVGRRLNIKDEDGEGFLGEITGAKTGTSKDGAENVTIVRILYDDGETDSELDLGLESFDWAPAKKEKKSKSPKKPAVTKKKVVEPPSESSSDESDSESSSANDSESEGSSSGEDEPQATANKSSNSEERGVKKLRAYGMTSAFFKKQFAEEGIFPEYAMDREPKKRKAAATKKKKKKKKKKKTKKKYAGLTTEERRAERRRRNERKLLVKEARQKRLLQKQEGLAKNDQEAGEGNEPRAEAVVDEGLKRVDKLEVESEDEDDDEDDEDMEEEQKPVKKSRQQLEDEAEWAPLSVAPRKRKPSGSGNASKGSKRRRSNSASKKEKKKKKHKSKPAGQSSFFAECNKRLLKYTATSDGPKKKVKKILKEIMKKDDITLKDIKNSGIAKTITLLTKHEDPDYQQWSKGLRNLWKQKFSS